MAMEKGNFNNATRFKESRVAQLVRPAGGGIVSFQIPKAGLVAGIALAVRITLTGTLGTANVAGLCTAISRVRVTANNGIDIYNVSGIGYTYLLQEMVESEYFLASGQNEGRTLATIAANRNLDMYIPIQMNMRDPIGLLLAQNESTVLTVSIEFAPDAQVATTAVVAATVDPTIVWFTLPFEEKDFPPLNVVHQILEDSQVVAGAGEISYQFPKGNTYLQAAHGLGLAVAGADNFTTYRLRVNQADYLIDVIPSYLDLRHRYLRGRARPPGSIFVDFLASSGLGNYGLLRDVFNANEITDFASVIQASGAGTLFTIRRQLLKLD